MGKCGREASEVRRVMRRHESGQVLVLAVLLLMLMAILGAAFVAVISHTMSTTTRTGDVLTAQQSADGAISLFQRMMLTSPMGADLRLANWAADDPFDTNDLGAPPPGPSVLAYYRESEIERGLHEEGFVKIQAPLEVGDQTAGAPLPTGDPTADALRGRAMLKVEYVPSDYLNAAGAAQPLPMFSGNPMANYIRVVAVGTVPGNEGVYRLSVGYLPILITDQLITAHDAARTGASQAIGTPTMVDLNGNGYVSDLDGSGGLDSADEIATEPMYGGIFANTGVDFYGGASPPDVSNPVPMEIRLDQQPTVSPRVAPNPALGGRLGLGERVQIAGPITRNAPPGGAMSLPQLWFNGAALGVAEVSYSAPGIANPLFNPFYFFDPFGPLYMDDLGFIYPLPHMVGRAAIRVAAPRLDRTNGDGDGVLRKAAMESGVWFDVTGAPVAGDPDPAPAGQRLNTAQLGFGTSLFINNPTDRQNPDVEAMKEEWLRTGAGANASTWYGPLYMPPGAEIIFLDADANTPASLGCSTDPSAGPLGNDPAVPDIMVRLHPDPTGRTQFFRIPWNSATGRFDLLTPDQTAPLDADGDGTMDTTAYIDYPRDGVIYVAGNARVSGRLATPGNPDLRPDWEYNITLIAEGNVYVEGNLLRPSDRDPALGEYDTARGLALNSRIALLAGESVVVNGTRILMPLVQTNAPIVPNQRGVLGRSHWELRAGDQLTGAFSFTAVDDWNGDDRADSTAENADIFLKLRVKGTPGAAFSLFVNNTPYDFDRNPAATGPQPFRYLSGAVQIIRIPLRVGGTDYVPFDDAVGQSNIFRIAAATTLREPLELYSFCIEPRVGDAVPIDAIPDDPAVPESLELQVSGLVHGGEVYPMDAIVSALMYAQNGTYFVIPGDHFDPSAAAIDRNGDGVIAEYVYPPSGAQQDVNGDGVMDPSDVDLDFSGQEDWIESRRYNMRLTVNGAIAPSTMPDILSVAAWCDKWSWWDTEHRVKEQSGPWAAPGTPNWGMIRYVYDPGLRSGRRLFYTYTAPDGRVRTRDYLPRFPRLPVSDDLIYTGSVVPPAG